MTRRYLGLLAFSGTAAVALLIFRVFLGAPFDAPHVWISAILVVIGLVALLIEVMIDPAMSRPGARVLHRAGVLTALGAVGFLLALVFSGDWYTDPIAWAFVALSVMGQAEWIVRIGALPPDPRPRGRLRRLVLLSLLAAPTVPMGLFVATAIAIQGDVTWMAAPLAAPALLTTPLFATAVWRTLRPPHHRSSMGSRP